MSGEQRPPGKLWEDRVGDRQRSMETPLSEAPFLEQRLSEEQFALLRRLLWDSPGLATIVNELGSRRLTYDERESVRKHLAGRLDIDEEGNLSEEGRRIDEVVGLLMFY